MDLLEQLKREQEAKMAEGSPWAPPAKASSENAAPVEVAGGAQMPCQVSGREGWVKKSQRAVKPPEIAPLPPAEMPPQQSNLQ